MFKLFNTNDDVFFIINSFSFDTPINITTLDKKFLSCHEFNNEVDFYTHDDNSGRQKWVIEKSSSSDNVYYIRCKFNRYNFTQYLGCPNKNNQVFLYTLKNKYTKWCIKHVGKNVYNITYIGEKFNKNDLTIVVARYNEDVNWAFAYNDIVTLYNKGGPIKDLNFSTIINLENIGREGHTYLYHIIQNYYNLSSRVVFLQGDPFPHNESVLFGIDNHKNTLDVQPLGLRYLKFANIPPENIEEKFTKTTDYGLKYLVLEINEDTDYVESNYFHDNGHKNVIINYKNMFPQCKSLVENFFYRSNFVINKPINNIRYTWCGLFSVLKQNILKHDINVYKNFSKELTSFCKQGGTNGYILERLWLYIFE